jgi:hypothetical protein
MEPMRQTTVTEENRENFYKSIYKQQHDSPKELIDISSMPGDIIAVDCCGWHYRTLFPGKKIFCLETLLSGIQFQFKKNQVDKLIDNRDIQNLVWPSLTTPECSVIFDRSMIIRYLTVNELCDLLTTVSKKYQPKMISLRGETPFIDDDRLTDRFYNFAKISVPGFVVTRFLYDTATSIYEICLRCKV